MEKQILSRNLMEPIFIVEHETKGDFFTSSLILKDKANLPPLLVVSDSKGMIYFYRWKGGMIYCINNFNFLDESIISIKELESAYSCYILIQYRNGKFLLCTWDNEYLLPLQWINGNDCSFCSFAYSSILGIIALLNEEGNISLLNFNGSSDSEKHLNLFKVLKIERDPNNSIMFISIENTFLIVGFDDGSLRVYDNNSNNNNDDSLTLIKDIQLIKGTLTSLELDNGSIWIASSSNYIIYFDSINSLIEGNPLPISIELPNQGISSFAIGNDIFCSGGWDGMLRFFSINNKEQLFVSNIHSSSIIELKCFTTTTSTSTTMSSQGIPDPRRLSLSHSEFLVSLGKDGRLAIFSLRKNIKS